jgi:DNA repair protein RecN (Recombination protein N)
VIESIDIHDLGVISRAELPLGPGLTVLTGETGAGKTMVVTALGLLLGDRADTTRVRSGAEACWVEGRFVVGDIPEVSGRVAEIGGSIDDGVVILSRHVPSQGSSKAVVGGRAAPVALLQEIANHLVVVHGQSDQVRLKSESAQRDALDRFAGPELATVLTRYQDTYRQLRSLEETLAGFDADARAAVAESEALREAIERIERVRPVAGEDERLKALSERLANTEELRTQIGLAKQALQADTGGVDEVDAQGLLSEALRAVERVQGADAELGALATALRDAQFQVSEIAVSLAGYLSGLELDAEMDLEQVMTRRAELTDLVRSYGPTLDDVLAYEASASDRLLALDRSEDRRAELQQEVSRLRGLVEADADTLHSLRFAAGARLSGLVTEELAALAMANAQFVVSVDKRTDFTLHGRDQVNFLLASHSGAEPRALGKGASGGELSRVMLALEVVIAGVDSVPTFIFDEVDAGVGGASALEIGRRLARLAEHAQVIVVTHLAQVASFADNHLQVTKDSSGHFTQSGVVQLSAEQRVVELARMLGGDSESTSALDHAREMLERASVSR